MMVLEASMDQISYYEEFIEKLFSVIDSVLIWKDGTPYYRGEVIEFHIPENVRSVIESHLGDLYK